MSELKFKEFIFQNTPTKENFSTTMLDKLPLTMSYTPMQRFGDLYTEEEALKHGTLFIDLDKPFYGKFTGAKR